MIVEEFVPTRGEKVWINEAHRVLNEVVTDYDPNLVVAELPSELRHTDFLRENFYLVYDFSRNSAVFYFNPNEPPSKVLARIWRADTRKTDVLKNLDDEEQATKLLQMRKQMDDAEMRKDIAGWAMKNNLNFPQFKPPGSDTTVLFDDKLRRLGKGRK